MPTADCNAPWGGSEVPRWSTNASVSYGAGAVARRIAGEINRFSSRD